MKILFVGNSYTYYNDMPLLFEGLCRENEKDVTVFSVTQGGRELRAYGDSRDATTQKLEAVLKENRFDICFLQEQSTLPLRDYEAFLSGIQCVAEKVKADRFILYATWGRKAGSRTLETYGWTTESMTKLLSDAYTRAAGVIGAEISPVGQCFYEATCRNPGLELYNPDLSHPSYLGSCLATLIHYLAIFGQLPDKIDTLSIEPEAESCFRGLLAE